MWRYRDLFLVLAWRDIAVRYKQTTLGVSWAVFQPFVTMILSSPLFFYQLYGEDAQEGYDNAIQAFRIAEHMDVRLPVMMTINESAVNQVYNVAIGDRTTLIELFHMIRASLEEYDKEIKIIEPAFGPFRSGDVRHSQASTTKAKRLLGYQPSHIVNSGMKETV